MIGQSVGSDGTSTITIAAGDLAHTSDVLFDIAVERGQQNDKWGKQNHVNGTDRDYTDEANYWKRYNDSKVAETGDTDWTGILLEEVFEGVSEVDDDKLREELVQVAAVAAAWIEDIDSREEDRG